MKKLLVSLLWLVSCLVYGGKLPTDYIPVNAVKYLPLLKAEQMKFWSDHPAPMYLAGLAEQESCLSLTHSKCWNPQVKLDTSREFGAGVFQLTKAYTKTGALRFDSLIAMQKQFPALKELNWGNVLQRPDLQFRAAVLMSRTNFKALSAVTDTTNQLSFADAAYNAGLGSVQNRRRACGMKAGCDPQVWFGHVEKICLTGNTPLYGQRTACDINREHVHSVMKLRSFKYAKFMA